MIIKQGLKFLSVQNCTYILFKTVHRDCTLRYVHTNISECSNMFDESVVDNFCNGDH